MADITMCSGENCPLKNKCYRFTAKESQRQSYFEKAPIEENGDCKYFWQNSLK